MSELEIELDGQIICVIMERHIIACGRANTAVFSREDVRHKSFIDVLGSQRPKWKIVGERERVRYVNQLSAQKSILEQL